MSTTAIVAILLWTIFVACVAYVLGAFYEHDRQGGSREAHQELRKAYLANEELKELLWLVMDESDLKPAGALPKSTVTVERSRHLHSVRITNRGGA